MLGMNLGRCYLRRPIDVLGILYVGRYDFFPPWYIPGILLGQTSNCCAIW